MKGFLLAAAFLAGSSWPASSSEVIAPGARLQKLAGGFLFTEGAASDAEGNVYFTDQPNNRIVEWSTDGKLTTFLDPAGRSNGLCFDASGNLWACADEKNELWRIDPSKNIDIVLKAFEAKPLNGPNDVWIRPDGGLYFTDPYYQREYWDRHEPAQDQRGVYYLAPDRKKFIRVVADLVEPNGLIGTPDGKMLYVADIGGQKTYRYTVQPDGSLTDKTLFCEMGSDGMTIDRQGNIYLTGAGVTIFAPTGKEIARIDVPEKWVGNICFGGKDRKTLFITASKGLYAMRMTVAGVGSQ
jgi:gluconolactonase